MKCLYEQGKLDEKWVRDFCWVSNKKCVRYEMEESGKSHPDNMLPDGSILDELKT